MGLFLVCFLVGWFLTPYAIGLFWLIIALAPFIALYNGESANLILILFCLSALLMPGPFRSLYAAGAAATIIFIVLSSVAVAAFAYVASHPAEIAIAVVIGMMILLLFFIPRKPLDGVNEQQPHENTQQLVVTFHPHPSIGESPRLIGHEGGPPCSEKPSANPP